YAWAVGRMNQPNATRQITGLIGLQMPDKMPIYLLILWGHFLQRIDFLLPFLHVRLAKITVPGLKKRTDLCRGMGLTDRHKPHVLRRAPRPKTRRLYLLTNPLKILLEFVGERRFRLLTANVEHRLYVGMIST